MKDHKKSSNKKHGFKFYELLIIIPIFTVMLDIDHLSTLRIMQLIVIIIGCSLIMWELS